MHSNGGQTINQPSAEGLQIKAEGICDWLLIATPERSRHPLDHVEEDEPLIHEGLQTHGRCWDQSDDVSTKKEEIRG